MESAPGVCLPPDAKMYHVNCAQCGTALQFSLPDSPCHIVCYSCRCKMVIRPKVVNPERAPDPRSSSFVLSAGCSPGTALAAALLQAKLALRMASDTRIAIHSPPSSPLPPSTPAHFPCGKPISTPPGYSSPERSRSVHVPVSTPSSDASCVEATRCGTFSKTNSYASGMDKAEQCSVILRWCVVVSQCPKAEQRRGFSFSCCMCITLVFMIK